MNAVSLAELCVGDAEPATVADRLRSWGVEVLDIPAAAAEPCARAYLAYRRRRKAESGRDAPSLPLPDFFIAAHAQIMGWTLATADTGRYARFYMKMLEQGVYLAPSQFEAGFLSLAHSKADIEKTVAAAFAAFQEIKK